MNSGAVKFKAEFTIICAAVREFKRVEFCSFAKRCVMEVSEKDGGRKIGRENKREKVETGIDRKGGNGNGVGSVK